MSHRRIHCCELLLSLSSRQLLVQGTLALCKITSNTFFLFCFCLKSSLLLRVRKQQLVYYSSWVVIPGGKKAKLIISINSNALLSFTAYRSHSHLRHNSYAQNQKHPQPVRFPDFHRAYKILDDLPRDYLFQAFSALNALRLCFRLHIVASKQLRTNHIVFTAGSSVRSTLFICHRRWA